MNNGITENISFTKKELTEDELLVIIEKYPYYSIAQFRLLSEYKKNKNKNFDRQALVTALFFTNTRWLNRQLYYQAAVEDKYNENLEVNNSGAAGVEEQDSLLDEIVQAELVETNENNLPST